MRLMIKLQLALIFTDTSYRLFSQIIFKSPVYIKDQTKHFCFALYWMSAKLTEISGFGVKRRPAEGQ